MTKSTTPSFTPILLITLRSDQGGGPRHVYDLLQFLKEKKRYRIHIASPLSAPYGEKFKNDAFSHFELPHRTFSLIKFIQLFFYCLNHGIKTVHSHGRGAGIYSRLLKLANIKVIHTFHGVHQPEGLIGFIKNQIDKILEVFTDASIFVSESEYQQAKSLGMTTQDHHQIIPNGLSTKTKDDHLEDKYDHYRIHQNSILVGTLTRLDEHKGNQYLLGYFRKLPEHFHLLIAGDGPQRPELQKQIQNYQMGHRIHLLGNIDDPDSFLRSIDIFTSASKSEGLPYSILEAMYLKVPILASRVSGHIDLLHSDNLFNRENMGEYVYKIQSTILTKNLEEHFNRIHEDFDLEKNFKRLANNYHHNP